MRKTEKNWAISEGGILWVLRGIRDNLSHPRGGGGIRLLNGMACGQSHTETNSGRHTVAQGLQRFH